MSYLNQVIKRTKPMTRCQCAVLAVVTEEWATTDQIWRRGALYAANRRGHIRPVAYGTVSAILRGLVQQGYVEVRGSKCNKQYRSVTP